MVDVDVDWILNISIILKPTTRDSTWTQNRTCGPVRWTLDRTSVHNRTAASLDADAESAEGRAEKVSVSECGDSGRQAWNKKCLIPHVHYV
jgi:hypothetical protein